MKIAIGMITAPRTTPTIERSIASLRAAGFDEGLHVFAEPDAFVPAGVTVTRNPTKLGCYSNWRKALEGLVATNAEHVLLLQDDVVWSAGAAAIVREKLAATPAGLVSPYASPVCVPGRKYRERYPGRYGEGWTETNRGRGFWGALALGFPLATAKALLACPKFLEYREQVQVDVLLGRCMIDLGLPTWVFLPSLCDHVGVESTVTPERDGARSFREESSRRGWDFGRLAPAVSQAPTRQKVSRVVISMTTIPARNGTLGPTIESLKAQMRPPDEIRLYLTKGCQPVEGVTCLVVEDRGPVTKLSAAVDPSVPDDALIVTVDDDILYDPKWLETLVAGADLFPDDAVCMAGWNGREEGNRFRQVPPGPQVVLLQGRAQAHGRVVLRGRRLDLGLPEATWDREAYRRAHDAPRASRG
jgi:hypothetical protein